jgi:pyruvyl transferase EpsO
MNAEAASLSREIDAVLEPLLPPGMRCALLDFPAHSNVGDSAIWLGEQAWLRRRGCELVYTCDTATYSPGHLARRDPDVVLLHGGGNLGDFWAEHQRFRECVIESFPGRRMILLPQTIHFLHEANIAEARRVFGAHKSLTLLCRDRVSLEFARAELGCPCLLCPDMAFALGPCLPRPGAPEVDGVWLARTDAESRGRTDCQSVPQTASVERLDWLEEPATALSEQYQSLAGRLELAPPDWPALADALLRTCEPLARERLERGCRILARGRVVITDRLHGHILCLLLGIPHVLLDNNYGKVGRFHRTWTRAWPLVRWAGSPAEAIELGRALLRTPG